MYFLYKFVVSLFYRGEKLWGFSFVHCGEVFNTVSLYQRVLFERFHCIVCTETILFEVSVHVCLSMHVLKNLQC